MKRAFAAILAIVMIIAALPAVVFADSPTDVFIDIDGVVYRAHKGDIIDYVVYLCTGEMLCSLDGELYFSPDGLALVPEETEELTVDEQIFPKIGSMVVTNVYQPGRMAFNYSSPNGKDFSKETAKLIRTQFRVIAESGAYELNTTLSVVCGADEKKYIYNGEVVNSLARYEIDVPNRQPYDPNESEPTEASTVPATEAPTEPPTEAPTEPAPRVLTDPLTGVFVEHETADALIVTPIGLSDFRYYLFRFDNLAVYEISLLKDGEKLVLEEPVKVTIPAPEGAKLFTLGDLSSAAVDAEYADGRLAFADADLGLFAVSADGTAPVMALYGNVDGDSGITVIDATHIQRDLAGLETFTADQKMIGDVDGDGATTIVDATYIQRWLAGLSSKLDRFGYPRKTNKS